MIKEILIEFANFNYNDMLNLDFIDRYGDMLFGNDNSVLFFLNNDFFKIQEIYYSSIINSICLNFSDKYIKRFENHQRQHELEILTIQIFVKSSSILQFFLKEKGGKWTEDTF